MPIDIVIIDDSEVIRFLMSKSLERDPDMRVVGTAVNGIEGISVVERTKPTVVLLDLDMPQMDGLTALPKICAASPASKVIVVSGNAKQYANAALRSLSMGATDFILKPGAEGALKPQEFNDALRAMIKSVVSPEALTMPPLELPRPAIAGSLIAPVTAVRTSLPGAQPYAASRPITLRPASTAKAEAIAITASTGGPEALKKLFHALRGKLKHVPIFITQHMPPTFASALAEHLTQAGERPCVEASNWLEVQPGCAYVAPSGSHMSVHVDGGKQVIRLIQGEPIQGVIPSADPMFASASHVYGAHLLAVVLTGTGSDGMGGLRSVIDYGGSAVAQDEVSATLYALPRNAAESGMCEAVLALDAMAAYILARCSVA